MGLVMKSSTGRTGVQEESVRVITKERLIVITSRHEGEKRLNKDKVEEKSFETKPGRGGEGIRKK